MIHALKIEPQHFEPVVAGTKSFEVRRNDRGFAVGDLLGLNEYDEDYTGRSCMVYVDYILDDPEYCKDGYVILGIKPCCVHKITEPYNPARITRDYGVPLAPMPVW